MNHSLWELSLYHRHRHDELLAERRTCAAVSLLPVQSALSTFRRALGLQLISAGRALAGAEGLRESNSAMHPAV